MSDVKTLSDLLHDDAVLIPFGIARSESLLNVLATTRVDWELVATGQIAAADAALAVNEYLAGLGQFDPTEPRLDAAYRLGVLDSQYTLFDLTRNLNS